MAKLVLGTKGSTAAALDICQGLFIADAAALAPLQVGKTWEMTLFSTTVNVAGVSQMSAEADVEVGIGLCGPAFAAHMEIILPDITTDANGPLDKLALRFNGAAGYKGGLFFGASLNAGMSIVLSTWVITLPTCKVDPIHCHTEGAQCHRHHWHIHCSGPHTTCSGGSVHCSGGGAGFTNVLSLDIDVEIDLVALIAEALGITSITGSIDVSSEAQIDLADKASATNTVLKPTFVAQMDMVNRIKELKEVDDELKSMGGSLSMGPEFSITLQTVISLVSFDIDQSHYSQLTWGQDANGKYVEGTLDAGNKPATGHFGLGFHYDTSFIFSIGVYTTIKAFKVLSIAGHIDIPVFKVSAQRGNFTIQDNGVTIGAVQLDESSDNPSQSILPDVYFHPPEVFGKTSCG